MAQGPTVKAFPEVLLDELAVLRPGWNEALPPQAGGESLQADEALKLARLARLHDLIHRRGAGEEALSALCLSGGGIRSATFNLGLLQALARKGALHRFDYLSTVSGGGYVGSWLEAWIARRRRANPSGDAVREVAALLCSAGPRGAGPAPDPERAESPEPLPIRQLRDFSNYLTPRLGLLSADTWALAAHVVRNLLLNWLVALPVAGAAVMLPQAAYIAVDLARASAAPGSPWGAGFGYVALALALLATITASWARSEKRGPPAGDGAAAREDRRRRVRAWRRTFVFGSAGLLVASAALMVLAALLAQDPWRALPGLGFLPVPGGDAGRAELWARTLRTMAWTVGIPVLGRATAFALRGEKPEPAAVPIELGALVVSGGVAALLVAWLMGDPWTWVVGTPDPQGPAALPYATALLTVLAVPVILVVYVLARALYTGMIGVADDRRPPRDEGERNRRIGDDADREWSARLSGLILQAAFLWVAASGLVLLAGGWVATLLRQTGVWIASGATAASVFGIATALLGLGAGTSAGRGRWQPASRVKEVALRVAAPITVAGAVILLAQATWAIATAVGSGRIFFSCLAPGSCWPELGDLLFFCALALALVALGCVAGLFVDVNRFSLHGLYRMRLIRAYLGASNEDRRPNPNTGFDPEDAEVRLAELVPAERRGPVRLFPIVNSTLNLVRGEPLAWQQRKAESFSMTPLHCGSFQEGFRRTADYGSPAGGLSLGTAMAISGAAANPNMGYVSSPPLTCLMTLLNARLGVWLPNPGKEGGVNTARRGPRFGTGHLLRELVGATNAHGPYVNLSDGGHFDNLGLYEVVRRRCRLVLVSDAACDATFTFGDLGNAVRKIRMDFGIPITFEGGIHLAPRRKKGAPPRRGLYCAVGTIHYEAVDEVSGGARARAGTLVYLKPTLAPSEGAPVPVDVQAFARESPSFPQESTMDQWFSESQFESYRALGDHLVSTLLGPEPIQGLEELLERARAHSVLEGAQVRVQVGETFDLPGVDGATAPAAPPGSVPH